MKEQIVMVISQEQAVFILPYEAKYTLVKLFCRQPNMIG